MAVIMMLALILAFCQSATGSDLPQPRIVIIGQTGAGKSTLANVLLGESPDCTNCTFPVCNGHESCTKHTKYAIGCWLGDGDLFTIVDTPGFGDSNNEENDLIDEMMNVLTDVIDGANTLILLINGQDERFDQSMQQMMREMQAMFGEEFWTHTIIGVSHWPYDANSVNQRNYTGKTEEIFMEEWNTLLSTKFHIDLTLEGVFIDSWSQQPWNIGDQLQQEAFAREVEKLRSFARKKDLFPFRKIDDVLRENQEMKAEIKWLNDVITNNISQIMEQHSTDVAEIRSELDMKNVAPIGTILPWTPFPDRDTSNPVAIPPGWLECNGQEIMEGRWKGKRTPDLNNDKRFLRGATVGDALLLEDDQIRSHSHTARDMWLNSAHCPSGTHYVSTPGEGVCSKCGGDDYYCERTVTGSNTGGGETRPKNVNVVFIIKIK